MAPYIRNMNQVATYWPRTGSDMYGAPTFGSAVAIKCRWEDRAVQFRDAQGNETVSDAVVYPDRTLEIGGYLLRGTASGSPPATAREIRQTMLSPALRGSPELNNVML